MAFGIKITGIPFDNSYKIWVIENISYPVYKLKEDKLFRMTVDSSMYVDYVAVLNPEEALALHQKYRTEPFTEPKVKAEAELIAHLNAGAPKTCWVLFTIFEWESGY